MPVFCLKNITLVRQEADISHSPESQRNSKTFFQYSYVNLIIPKIFTVRKSFRAWKIKANRSNLIKTLAFSDIHRF